MVWLATVDGAVCHSLMPGVCCDDDARQRTWRNDGDNEGKKRNAGRHWG